ncbi:hypothetical protein F443_11334, partial [Phytophthora nicotianae P1569]
MSETASGGSAQVPSVDAPPSPTPPADTPAASSVAPGVDAGTNDVELVDPLLALSRRTPWPGSALTSSVRPLTKDGAAAWADSVRELDDKVKAAITGHPAGRIESPPAFFTLPMAGSSDSHSVVGIPANIEDYTSGANMGDGFGGLESIFPVEHLSDAEIRDVARLLGLDDGEGVSNSVLVPRGDCSEWPPRVFQDVVDSTRAKRELASLVRAFGCERLAARVFGTSTALHRAVKELREFQGQLNESALKNVKRVAELMIELDNVRSGFSILSNFWDDQFQLVRLEDEAEIQMALYEDISSKDDDERDADFQDSSPSGKSHNSSGRRATAPRGAKHKRDSESGASGKSSGGSDSGDPEHKRSRPSQERKQSALARKKYAKLTPEELKVVEVPGRGVVSWRHYGLLKKFPPGTANAVEQTAGFPDYTPILARVEETDQVRKHWLQADFEELLKTAPWNTLFEDRVQQLLLHRPADLSAKIHGLSRLVKFMSENRKAFWYVGHWFFVNHGLD